MSGIFLLSLLLHVIHLSFFYVGEFLVHDWMETAPKIV